MYLINENANSATHLIFKNWVLKNFFILTNIMLLSNFFKNKYFYKE